MAVKIDQRQCDDGRGRDDNRKKAKDGLIWSISSFNFKDYLRLLLLWSGHQGLGISGVATVVVLTSEGAEIGLMYFLTHAAVLCGQLCLWPVAVVADNETRTGD